MSQEDLLKKLTDAVIKGNAKEVEGLVKDSHESGISASRILNEGLVPAMETVGAKYQARELYIPHVLLAARAMKAGIAVIQDDLKKGPSTSRGRIVIGTVRHDIHDIGKNLVATMLAGTGFDVIDLGVDVSPEKFAEVARESHADVVGMSALLTTTMHGMKDTISSLKEGGFSGKVIIGGAPVTHDFATEIGADLFAEDAASAVTVVKQALGVG